MTSPRARLERVHRLRRAVRRRVLARRRPLAALCAGIAVAAGVHVATAPPPTTVGVLTAAHDLPAGAVLETADLRTLRLPPDAVPDGIADGAVGRTLAAPVRAGEPITDVRLVGADLATAHPDLATLPVRLPDAGQADLLRAGDRIDLIATDLQAGGSRVVAADALVLATPPADEAVDTNSLPGALVVLGVAPASVPGVAEASVRWFLSFSFSR
jgi:Flp pilus assembly protein CpaB